MFAMAITSISRDWGRNPSIVRITTTDNLATITANGYINTQSVEIESINKGSFEWVEGDLVAIDYSDGEGMFTRDSTTNSFVSTNPSETGSIVVPTITDHIVVALDNNGTIGNILTNQNKTAKFNGLIQSGLAAAGNPGSFFCYSSSGAPGGTLGIECNQNSGAFNITIENRAHSASRQYLIPDGGSPTSDFIISNFPGTQHIESGNLQIDSGNLTVTGDIIAQIPTPNTGSIRLRHINSGGDFFVLIQNKVMGQNTTYTIPDISSAVGAIVVSPSPSTMKPVSRAAVAGGSEINNIADSFCTEDSIVVGSFTSQANSASVFEIVPGNGTFQVISSADPGVAEFSYTIFNNQSF
jgi:hypothetical protein